MHPDMTPNTPCLCSKCHLRARVFPRRRDGRIVLPPLISAPTTPGASGSRHRQESVPRWTPGRGPGEASTSTSRDSWHQHHHLHQHSIQHHRHDPHRHSPPVPREHPRRSVTRPEPRQELIPMGNEPGTSERLRTSNRGQNHRRIPTNPPAPPLDTLPSQDQSTSTIITTDSINDQPQATDPPERPPTPPPLHTTIRTTPIIFRDPIIASGQNDSQSSSGAYQVKWDSERKRRQGYFAPGSEKSPFRHYNKEDCQ
ncbi:hypothetical protein BDQ17DRAFT_488635 [Cyathus striatus]|nr:hypothetical protein BDQ17DRAFT_488635 [Cyathus striatus]